MWSLIQIHSLFAHPPFKTITTSSAAVLALEKTQGYIVVISSGGAQLRIPGGSDPCISKFAVNRLVEYVVLGNFLNTPYLPEN
jgi:NAD(P)-dependent dehydrogenase (short-subunit alcohol dehydrogenase family)